MKSWWWIILNRCIFDFPEHTFPLFWMFVDRISILFGRLSIFYHNESIYSKSRKIFVFLSLNPSQEKYSRSEKKLSIKLLFDSLLMKTWAKWWFFAKNQNDGDQKWWIWCFVKTKFEGSTGVSLKSSDRRLIVADGIYALAVSNDDAVVGLV